MSGKVLEVRFQPGRKDQFTQRYTYDADNRLSTVSTSHDGVIWEQDASYTYYAHGPLRRTVLGRDLVQGLDYTYTIAGWLKGINLPTLSTEYDPGKDGLATGSNPTVGRDAFGMQLHYHNGDFTDGPTAFTGTRSEASFKGLYNGNIAGWSYTSRSENGTPQTTMLSTYSYDKLNRLKQDQPYTMVNNASTITSKWSSSYSYDLDGNITNLIREDGNGSGIDNLSYTYPASGGKTINNRLNHIVDQLAPNDNGKGVVTQDPGNYSYDATGNLIGDATEGITSITWTPYNKIRELVKTNAAPATGTTTLRYLYDAAGNRVVKDYHATQNTTLTSRTWYIRDAQGTVLAIYTRKPTSGNSGSVTRTEAPIYGSSRIGQSTRTATYDATASGEATLLGTVYSRELGKRAYELVDHLGNVRATISDILVPRTATNTYDADILTLTDYYPFGMQMDTRTWEAGGVAGHRYGYNGKENDDEVKGQGNSLDFGARMYDSRVGRFLSMDPLSQKYPSSSTYSSFHNNPLYWVDPDGRENVPALLWAAKNMANRGIPFDEEEPFFSSGTKRWKYTIGIVPDRTVCYESCFMAYMNSGSKIVQTLRSGFTNGKGAFYGRSSRFGGENWFAKGDGTVRKLVTDITKGELGDIVFMGEPKGMEGHAVLLASDISTSIVEIDGKQVPQVSFYALSTGSHTDINHYGGRSFRFTKDESGVWRDQGGKRFNGFGQLTQPSATEEEKSEVLKAIEVVKEGKTPE